MFGSGFRRSREKARLKQIETKERVEGLKTENVNLENKVETLKVCYYFL